jgi:hypothetical protein
MNAFTRFAALVVGLFTWVFGCASTMTTHGVPNLHQVDDRVWRSGQITTASGWAYVKSLGVTDVIKLNYEKEGSDDLAAASGLVVHVLSIQPEGDQDLWDDVVGTFVLPDRSNLDTAQGLLRTPGRRYLVHCTYGEDRTGRVIAEYRVRIAKWTKDRALREAIALGYHLELLGLLRSWEWIP